MTNIYKLYIVLLRYKNTPKGLPGIVVVRSDYEMHITGKKNRSFKVQWVAMRFHMFFRWGGI